jgi:4-hydroxybenzoate polyprenyltransferase
MAESFKGDIDSETEPAAEPAAESASDIPVGGWVDRLMPGWTHPYIRLARYDRLIGAWLLLFPCWWSIGMALNTPGSNWSDAWLFAAFGLGALTMRGAG